MTPPGRDPATVALLQKGDQRGLRQLLEDHGGLVRERLRRRFPRVLDDSELDEALNLATIQVWRAASTYDPAIGPLRAWFSVIANNCALKLLAQRKRAGFTLGHDLDQEEATRAPAAAALSSARQRLMSDTLACLERLPPLQRAILQADLAAGGTAPAAALAEQLGTTHNSIYVSRLKGLRSLRRMLAQMGHHAPEPETTRTVPSELRAESG
jgi:RNA polymerase sigma factor (sigma-70 family)